jgi:hypothetical protein
MAEMERYNKIQARATEITERLRREELEGNNIIDADGDGDAMDGIEVESTSQGGFEVEEMDDIQNSSMAQGPVFSPRKTRSGRVRL